MRSSGKSFAREKGEMYTHKNRGRKEWEIHTGNIDIHMESVRDGERPYNVRDATK